MNYNKLKTLGKAVISTRLLQRNEKWLRRLYATLFFMEIIATALYANITSPSLLFFLMVTNSALIAEVCLEHEDCFYFWIRSNC